MNKEEFELSINMNDEEIERIKNILCASKGVRHYLLKIHNDEELDVVEYKEYQKLEQENKELKNKIEKVIEILKEHFVEEYIRSCDTSDGVGRYEIDTEHWTYKAYEQLKDSDVDE